MKACLVFSPIGVPTYMPIGIAYLKAYVEKSSDYKVRCIDLNIDFYNRLPEMDIDLIKKKIPADYPDDPKLENPEFVKDAKRYFKSMTLVKENPKLINEYNIRVNELSMSMIKIVSHAFIKYIEKDMYEEEIVELFLKNDIKRILEVDCDIVGFSMFSSLQFHYTFALAKYLKKHHNKTIVLGGAQMTHYDHKEILETLDFVDYLIVGEGELALLGLMDAIEQGKNIDSVPNLAYMKQKELVFNETNCVPDIDNLPFPDLDDFDFKQYLNPVPILAVLSTRGCHWRKCAFCTHHRSYMAFRRKSLDRFIEELKYYKRKYGIESFSFVDEYMVPPLLEKLSERLVVENMDIKFSCYSKPIETFTDEILMKMAKAGCKAIYWGAECFNQRLLDLIKKGTKVEVMKDVLKRAYLQGIKNYLLIIYNLPTESESELQETLDFLENNQDFIDRIGFGKLQVVKGSDMQINPGKYGIKITNLPRKIIQMNGKVIHGIIYPWNEPEKTKARTGMIGKLRKYKLENNRYRMHDVVG